MSKFIAFMSAVSMSTATLASPALAGEDTAACQVRRSTPQVAGQISAYSALGVLGTGVVVRLVEGYFGSSLAILFLEPLALGSGHVYAGDPWRGALVAAGGYGAMGLGTGAGMAMASGISAINPGLMANDRGLALILGSAAVVTLGYSVWAVNDATATAERATATP